MEHKRLDRHTVREVLLDLARSTARAGAGPRTREQLRDDLLDRCESNLERTFVHFLYSGGYKLPDRAQPLLPDYGTRPDFYYDEGQVCVYVDGPFHLYEERHKRDVAITSSLTDGGYGVVRVTKEEDWPQQIATHGWVFGGGIC